MELKNILGFVLMPLVLLLAAWCVRMGRLWSSTADYTVPWLCCAVAIAVLLLGITCLVSDRSPAEVPLRRVGFVWIGTMLVLGIGMVVDYFLYPELDDWIATAAEWVGFGVILAGTFWIPRLQSGNGTA